jgi:hypothetical protein
MLSKIREDTEHGERFLVLTLTGAAIGKPQSDWPGANRELSLTEARVEVLALGVTEADFNYALAQARSRYDMKDE